jgi:formamidopyrimidine-DNA glycosylase
MTGKPFLLPTGTAPDKHTHVVLDLDDGRSLHYSDSRKFGRFWLVRDPDEVVGKLGPEPLDEGFSGEVLAGKLAGRKAAIKALLLDQTIVAGVGNIYADEALFRAGIHPARSGGSLSQAEVERLADSIRVVLRRAIELCGSTLGASSIQNYLRLNGATGGFQDEHMVYGREDKTCLHCGQPIRRMILAQRSSHYCLHCQPEG